MRVNEHPDGEALLRHAGAFLEKNEAEAALLLGICASMPRASGARWLSVDADDATPIAVALRTPPYNVAISAAPREAVVALVNALRERGETLPGVTAPPEVARSFADLWTAGTGLESRVTMESGLYRLVRVVPPSPRAPGALRLAREQDSPCVAQWVIGFLSDAAVPEAQRDAARRRAAASIAAGAVFLWEDAGNVVSMAALTGPTPHGIRVSMVYTPPELRRRGYASACVAALSEHALASGRRFCMLYTDLANPTSNAIYQQIGYERIGGSTMIEVRPARP
jgi:predicted GNAT family acetyltransferase